MTKKELINNIMDSIVEIRITETENAINKCNLIVTYKHNKGLARLVSRSIVKYSIEWSADIIRDQVYATLYESLLKVAENLELEEINIDNMDLITPAFALTETSLKNTLIPASRKNRKGEIIEMIEKLIDNEEPEETLEYLLNSKLPAMENDKASHFAVWFKDNKEKILTKKQLAFLNNETIDMDRASACKIRKRIANRIIKAYEEKYAGMNNITASLLDKKETIESILEAKDFRAELLKHMEEDYIIDAIIDNVSIASMKKFNTGSNDEEVLREYRVALFKKLDKLLYRI